MIWLNVNAENRHLIKMSNSQRHNANKLQDWTTLIRDMQAKREGHKKSTTWSRQKGEGTTQSKADKSMKISLTPFYCILSCVFENNTKKCIVNGE